MEGNHNPVTLIKLKAVVEKMDEYLHKDSQWQDKYPQTEVVLREILYEDNKHLIVTTSNHCHMLLGEMKESISPEMLKIYLDKVL